MLIMNIGFLACFHAISLERSRFSTTPHYFSRPCSTEVVGTWYRSLVPSRIALTRGKIRPVTLGTGIGARTTHGIIMIAK